MQMNTDDLNMNEIFHRIFVKLLTVKMRILKFGLTHFSLKLINIVSH
jgi:hypothetical protein